MSSISRPTLQDTVMAIAEQWAKRSTCSARASVGCVIVDSNFRIIACGYNGSPEGTAHCDTVGCERGPDGHCMRSVHAEMNAIIQLAKGTGLGNLSAYAVVTTHLPCVKCATVIAQFRPYRVIYRELVGSKEEQATSLRILRDSGVQVVQHAQ